MTKMQIRPFKVRAPGRIVLFGEHSDYIGQDVIPAAIDFAIDVSVNPRKDNVVNVEYLDLGESDQFSVGDPVEPRHRRDYLRSSLNVLLKKGIKPSNGADITVRGDLPIAAGLSSSSALSVAAILTFTHLSNTEFEAREVAISAFEAEVVEFGESGGMQDHFASTYGGIVHLDFGQDCKVTRLPADLERFVIGDSCEKKEDTVGDIRRIKLTIESGYALLSEMKDDFDRRTTSISSITTELSMLPKEMQLMTKSSLRNRDMTRRAREVLGAKIPDPDLVGELLNDEHRLLRDGLGRSTMKIERMIQSALNAGALGCKVNGSGGGGVIVVYAPGKEADVSDAIKKAGGVPYIVKISQGATLTNLLL